MAFVVLAIAVFTFAAAPRIVSAQTATGSAAPQQSLPVPWQYGGFVDVGRLRSSTSPSNHLFRNRGTTPRVDEWDLNMTGAYLKKAPSASSRSGVELTVQEGRDSEIFGFSATAPNIGGADWLLHLGPTNVSYLAPIGNGLTVQGGIFSSFIGYDGLYAKDNLNYTRPWTGDYTPYLMMGVNASYSVTPRLTATALVVNGYWHLAHANDVPSVGGQLVYKATDQMTVKETVLYGPHQADTDSRYWRFFSDSIVERKNGPLTAALEYQIGTEGVAAPGDPRALWMAAQVPVKWAVAGPWSIVVRPEFAWDRDGRWIGAEQSVTAFTSTVEYRKPLGDAQAIVKLEYRVDHSRGPGGGFFTEPNVRPDTPGLTPTQHIFGVGLIVTFDSKFPR
jgi:Putative beta-barrel porin-2, OmpL-like. bbp2